jgi:hypothetical protein
MLERMKEPVGPQVNKRFGTWSVYLLAGQIALMLVLIAALFHRIGLMHGIDAGVTSYGQLHAADRLVRLTSDLLAIVFIVTAVMWCRWQYGAQTIVDELTSEPLLFTPGWAVGWWFVPFANLVMPFRTLRELWKASHGGDSWEDIPTSAVISIWWLSWAMVFALGVFHAFLSFHIGPSKTRVVTPAVLASLDSWTIGTLLARTVAASLALLIVRQVVSLQEATISRLTPDTPSDGDDAIPAPPMPALPEVKRPQESRFA